ncbi:Crp/Fnr family transcriptional regulator [Aureispira anguillae]|uniref:Crp/Fnr family transcriptional regulator n=1 Tax=Aureispira anguillae TaxID=2864201 RepID=A0A915YL52_9BACT|nr:Crp/Fnr family transcriptional regulator [Aureispira anguillae]BDS15019.1 Crp/Fnr family transcriptional regulator [Aureispira anguillae]
MEVSLDVINHFRTRYPFLEDEDIESVLDLVVFKTYNANDFFVRFEEVNTNIFLVLNGLFKTYYLDENGEEVIINFYKENDISGNWYSTLLGEPSKLCISALEPSVIIQVDIRKIDALAFNNINILRAYSDILKGKLISSLHKIWGNMNEKPEVRFLRLKEERADLLDRLSQKQIASFLGITPVSLSRIKKRLSMKS